MFQENLFFTFKHEFVTYFPPAHVCMFRRTLSVFAYLKPHKRVIPRKI